MAFKFKVGDEVELIENYMGYKKGTRFEVEDTIPTINSKDEGMFGLKHGPTAYGRRLKLVSKGWDNIELGDILVKKKEFTNIRDYERPVVLVSPTHIGYAADRVSAENVRIDKSYLTTMLLVDRAEAPKYFDIKGKTDRAGTVELTLEEVADKFNIPVAELRIKEK